MKKVHLLMIVVCIFTFASCSSSSNGPEEVVKKYMNDIKSENFDKAVKHFDMEDANKEDVEVVAAKLKAGYKETSGIKNFTVKKVDTNEEMGKANVEVTITYKDDTEVEQNFTLNKKENGDWKIDPSSK